MSSWKRIAMLGGTFDPIHRGHLLIAEQAYQSFALDRVIFMPAGLPPHKLQLSITPAQKRLAMLKLAIKDSAHFVVSRYELNRPGSSFTADTLRYLLGSGLAEEIFLIIGADSLLDLINWRESDYLLKNGQFIVAERPGYPLDDIFHQQPYCLYREHIHLLSGTAIDLSSSALREELREKRSVGELVPGDVLSYIKEHGLYQEATN